jgi:hypothetical protein
LLSRQFGKYHPKKRSGNAFAVVKIYERYPLWSHACLHYKMPPITEVLFQLEQEECWQLVEWEATGYCNMLEFAHRRTYPNCLRKWRLMFYVSAYATITVSSIDRAPNDTKISKTQFIIILDSCLFLQSLIHSFFVFSTETMSLNRPTPRPVKHSPWTKQVFVPLSKGTN